MRTRETTISQQLPQMQLKCVSTPQCNVGKVKFMKYTNTHTREKEQRKLCYVFRASVYGYVPVHVNITFECLFAVLFGLHIDSIHVAKWRLSLGIASPVRSPVSHPAGLSYHLSFSLSACPLFLLPDQARFLPCIPPKKQKSLCVKLICSESPWLSLFDLLSFIIHSEPQDLDNLNMDAK